MLLPLCEERKNFLLYYSRISSTIARNKTVKAFTRNQGIPYLKFFKISGMRKKNTTNVEALYASIPKWLITM